VYKREGRRIVRQQVVTGTMNDDQIVVVHGLEKDDEVLLTPPEEGAKLSLKELSKDLLPKDTTKSAKTVSQTAKQ
jgi:hypothetical protein